MKRMDPTGLSAWVGWLLVSLLMWPGVASAQLVTFDPANLGENAASSAASAQSVKNEFEMILQKKRDIELQMSQLQAALDQLKDLDVQELGPNLESIQKLERLLDQARELSYRSDAVGRQFDDLYGRLMPESVHGAPYEALKKKWAEEKARSDRELLESQAHAKERSDETTKTRGRLYPKLNKAQNSFQAAKLQNEQLALQSLQLQDLLDLQRAESRAGHVSKLEADRLKAAQTERAARQLVSMSRPQDASGPLSRGSVNFSDRAKNLVPRRHLHERPHTENANIALRDTLKSTALGLGKAKTAFFSLLFILAALGLFWTWAQTILQPKEEDKITRPVATQFVLFVILAISIANWGWIADGIRSYIMLGAGQGGNESVLNPGAMAEQGFTKVSAMFSPSAIREGGLMSDPTFTGRPPQNSEEARRQAAERASKPYLVQGGMMVAEAVEVGVTTIAAYLLVFGCGCAVLLIYFYVGWQIFVVQVEFMVVCSVAQAFLPFGMNKHTSFVANSAFSAVISSGVKLAVLNALVGLMEAKLTGAVTADIALKEMFNLLFVTGTFGLLIMHFPSTAAGIFSGGGAGFNIAGATMQLAGGVASTAANAPRLASAAASQSKSLYNRLTGGGGDGSGGGGSGGSSGGTDGGPTGSGSDGGASNMPPPSGGAVAGMDGDLGSSKPEALAPNLPQDIELQSSDQLTDRVRQVEMGPMEVNSFPTDSGGASGAAEALSEVQAAGAGAALSDAAQGSLAPEGAGGVMGAMQAIGEAKELSVQGMQDAKTGAKEIVASQDPRKALGADKLTPKLPSDKGGESS